jgi:CDP-diacylglycerol--glycerol-3-phosphate 3-phosphatidyltransferase
LKLPTGKFKSLGKEIEKLKPQIRKYLTKTPIGLMYTRLMLGFVVIFFSFFQVPSFRMIIVLIIILGVLTDIFDGIIARRLNVSTQKLRRMDSSVDQVFWICTLIGAYLICTAFFNANYLKLLILLAVEGLTYMVSFIRFKKEVATHAIFSKIWTLTIMATLIQIVVSCNSLILFNICFYLGILSRLEIIAILLVIREWTNDVPSVYHAILLRNGKQIKRNKFLNG